ncbi:13594_t:CDS:2, partial [Acaulospora colombiana]
RLAEEKIVDHQDKRFEDYVPDHYHKFRDVFSKESFDELPARKPWDHAIELKPGSEPFKCKIYPISPNEQAELDAFLDENLKPGKKSLKPDALSRRPDHGKGERDNENIVLLKPAFFKIQALRQGHTFLIGQEKELLKQIRNSKDLDEPVVKALEELKKSGSKRLEGNEWSEEQGLILFRGKVYVPKDPDLRRKIVEAHHDSVMTGHPGRWKTLEL